jgi:hypothetical protein
VVVPFFGRGILQRNRIYPRLLRDPATSEIVAVLDRAHLDETMKEAIETQQRQELERLLYVTLSRAKHTLVIVDDRALFQQRNGLPKNAAARLLGCAEATLLSTRFEALPTFAAPAPAPSQSNEPSRLVIAPGQSVVALTPITDTLADARVRAAHFRKRNPSALAELALDRGRGSCAGKLLRRTVAGPTWNALRNLVARLRRTPRLAGRRRAVGHPFTGARDFADPDLSAANGRCSDAAFRRVRSRRASRRTRHDRARRNAIPLGDERS